MNKELKNFINFCEDHGIKYDFELCPLDGREFVSGETQKAYLLHHFTVEHVESRFMTAFTKAIRETE